MRYNVSRILAGDPAPSVQISVHPIDAEGVRELFPLMECRDEIIREGVKALLARRESEMAAEDNRTANLHLRSPWEELTSVQLATEALLHELNNNHDRMSPYGNPVKRQEAWERFQKYAYQWY
jgi:hypothetical protein